MSVAKSIFFDNLVLWRAETRHLSSPTEILRNQYARYITSNGDAVPWLLEAIRNDPWIGPIALLGEITGVNPITPGDEGKIDAMAEAWLRWGKRRGHI